MHYVKGTNRYQVEFMCLDQMVEPESIARIIDAFVNSLDMGKMGSQKEKHFNDGRPSYNPRAMLKLYIYGNRSGIRSSRKLAKCCKVNIEAKWLMDGAEPDFRTIAEFRRKNISCMRNVFHEFNRRLACALELGFQSVDGTKIQASNSKDRNFTANKLDDRIKRLDQKAAEYMRQMDQLDKREESEGSLTREELMRKIKEADERKARYQGYLKKMEETGASQISLTDPDAKLMKNKNGYAVSYNIQAAVDSGTHIVTNYETTTSPTDHGLIEKTLKPLEKDGKIMEAVADKGYQSRHDMAECLENGIIPNVIMDEGKDSYEIEIPYEPCGNADELRKNTDSESLRKCLRSGVIPDAYREIITGIEIKEKKTRLLVATEHDRTTATEEKMKAKAAEGYFVRDIDRDIVYCPAGSTLRKKSVTKRGTTRYSNKLACSRCKYSDKCLGKTKASNYPFKVIEFTDKATLKPDRNWNETAANEQRKKYCYAYETKTLVMFLLHPDREKMSMRKCLSEHPFGTVKRALGCNYFLLRGKEKVDGESALFFLAYNIRRGINLLGFEKMMELMGEIPLRFLHLFECFMNKSTPDGFFMNFALDISFSKFSLA